MPRFSRSDLVRRVQYQTARACNAAASFPVSGSVKGYGSRHPANFNEYAMRRDGRQDSGFPDRQRIDLQFDIADSSQIAVVVHCFYADLMPELFDRLRNLPTDFDLFVMNASGVDMVVPKDLEHMRHSVVVEVESHGRDVFPIVQPVNSGIPDPYDLTLKLYAKKSPWHKKHTDLGGNGAAWKDQFFSNLVGSYKKVEETLNTFAADPTLGLVTAADSIVNKES